MKIDFRIPEKDDFPEILHMMETFYSIDHYEFDKSVSEKNLKTFLTDIRLGRLWMICLHNQPIGYIVLTFGFSFEYHGRDAFIDELFIKEEYRNKGIGKKAMKFIERESSELGIHAIHLEVENHNEKANHLYLQQGYTGNNRALLTKKL